ncbi:MAG: hypothetical protein ACFKPT_04910 [Gloeotrichia echinulata GP01]
MSNICRWFQGLGVVTVSAIALCGNSAIAQITQDTVGSQEVQNFSASVMPPKMQLKYNCWYDEDGNWVCKP